MNYRTNPKTGRKHSLLGFGALRFPPMKEDPGRIDEEESIRMLRYAIDHGVNYIDTAYTYLDGKSEELLAEALKDGYGDKVAVATKLPSMMLAKAEEHEKYLETSLRRLKRDNLEFYLLHGITERYWPTIQKLDTVSFIQKKKEEGVVKNIGFSFHGETFAIFKEVIDFAPWDCVQIQLNYMDANIQAGIKGLEYAASKGLAVIIMEPLKGGKLTTNIPQQILDLMDTLEVKRTPADWGLRWVANRPEVTTILSGMSTMDQVKENIDILSDADAGCLSEKEIAILARVAEEYSKLIAYQCTGCAYCRSGCPKKIEIPRIIGMLNDASIYNAYERAKFDINHFIRQPPSTCVVCKKCEDVCPQHLKISDIMKEAAQYEDESMQYWRAFVKPENEETGR